jgi:hypothetical protein
LIDFVIYLFAIKTGNWKFAKTNIVILQKPITRQITVKETDNEINNV